MPLLRGFSSSDSETGTLSVAFFEHKQLFLNGYRSHGGVVVFCRTEVGKGTKILGKVSKPGHVVFIFLVAPPEEKELQEDFPLFGIDGDRMLCSESD